MCVLMSMIRPVQSMISSTNVPPRNAPTVAMLYAVAMPKHAAKHICKYTHLTGLVASSASAA